MAGRPGREFDMFVAEHGVRLLKLAYLLTGSGTNADDLVQEALTKMFLTWPRVQNADSPAAYARQVVVNANRRRFGRRRVSEILDGRIHERAREQAEFAIIDDQGRLAAALASLPRAQRTVVVLRYYEDLPEAEVAALIGCSVGTVKSQASRGLAKLRDHPSLSANPSPLRDGVTRA